LARAGISRHDAILCVGCLFCRLLMRENMKLETAAALMLVTVLAGCAKAETEPAQNVKAGIANLKAKVSVESNQSGQFWWEYRRTGGPWIETVPRSYGGVKATNRILTENLRTDCTGISSCTDVRLKSNTRYEFRFAATVNGTGPFYVDADGRISGTNYDSFVTGSRPKVFPILYTWWDKSHWGAKLGPNYPYAEPWPLPAKLDAQGCNPTNLYAGNQLTDVSHALADDLDRPAVIERYVREASSRGLAGFMVNWVNASDENARLAEVLRAANEVNAEGKNFKIILDYRTNGAVVPMTRVISDLQYFVANFRTNPALDHSFSAKPEVVVRKTRDYSEADKTALKNAVGRDVYLIGDESYITGWDAKDATNFEANSYYWSSQDPYNNPQSFSHLQTLSSQIHAAGDKWLAPFTPGYNTTLDGGSCIPRELDGKTTLRELFNGNKASNPDAWTLISWNEIAEGTYVLPLTRWGDKWLEQLEALLAEQ
jgi:hypothetical protein